MLKCASTLAAPDTTWVPRKARQRQSSREVGAWWRLLRSARADLAAGIDSPVRAACLHNGFVHSIAGVRSSAS